jgi:hypothetical protein
MHRPKRNSERRAWLIAWAVALILHAGAILAFRDVASPKPASAMHRLEPIRLVFKSPKAEPSKSEEPHFFTELPPDRADAKPKKADFLSNVTSRARDLVPGGDAATPRMQGEGDAPTVKLEPDGGTSAPTAAPSPPQPPASPRAAETQQSNVPAQERTGTAGASSVSPKSSEPDTARPTAAGATHAPAGTAGKEDIFQPEMDNPDGNASLRGDVSLNTIAWNYAPWLQHFGRQVMGRWMPPAAYSLGILKEGGWAIIEVEISRSGKMLRLERLEEQGHPSLILAAESALRSVNPIEPLPADFPEPTLILRIRMIYPRIRPR